MIASYYLFFGFVRLIKIWWIETELSGRRPVMVLWVVGSIPSGGTIELSLHRTSALHMV